MVLHIPITLTEAEPEENQKVLEHEVTVSEELNSVSKQHIGLILQ